MVSTRRQRAQSHEEKEEPASHNKTKPESEAEESEDDHQVEITNTTTSTNSVEKKKATKKGKKLSAQELRKQQREQARAKELGLLPKTSAEEGTKNKPTKIVFDSDDNEDLDESEQEEGQLYDAHDDDEGAEEGEDVAEKASNNENSDSDDDDAVEQMDSRVAKDLALEERQRERETKVVSDIQSKKKKKKRKKSHKIQEKRAGSDDDEDLLEDDDFFAELDAQRSSRRKKKKADQIEVQPKHTVFQTTMDKHLGHVPIEVNPGMELVVLEEDDYDKTIYDEDDNNIQDSLILGGEEPSETAVFHSRAQIVDGSDIISHKQMQKQRKHGLKPPDANWKRSKKMNRMLLSKGKGQAAATFAVKTYKF